MTLEDVLRYHKYQRQYALIRAMQPSVKEETRLIWESQATMHGDLARAVTEAIEKRTSNEPL